MSSQAASDPCMHYHFPPSSMLATLGGIGKHGSSDTPFSHGNTPCFGNGGFCVHIRPTNSQIASQSPRFEQVGSEEMKYMERIGKSNMLSFCKQEPEFSYLGDSGFSLLSKPVMAVMDDVRMAFQTNGAQIDNTVQVGASSKSLLTRHSSSPAAGVFSCLVPEIKSQHERLNKLHLSSLESRYSRTGGCDSTDDANIIPSPTNPGTAVKLSRSTAGLSRTESGENFVLNSCSNNSSCLNTIKRGRDLDAKSFLGATLQEHQQKESLQQGSALVTQFVLPSATSPGSMDKISPNFTAYQARAKRGCATHPRSIAERVRRTKISERMRKLQELVPNMDKQANTADMLEEAVEYIKSLQRQVQELTESKPKCDGSCRQISNSLMQV